MTQIGLIKTDYIIKEIRLHPLHPCRPCTIGFFIFPTRRGAQCAPAALKGNCSFLGRAYLSNILIQHILQSLLG